MRSINQKQRIIKFRQFIPLEKEEDIKFEPVSFFLGFGYGSLIVFIIIITWLIFRQTQ